MGIFIVYNIIICLLNKGFFFNIWEFSVKEGEYLLIYCICNIYKFKEKK